VFYLDTAKQVSYLVGRINLKQEFKLWIQVFTWYN